MQIKITNSASDTLNIIRISAALAVLIGHSFSFFQIGFLKDNTYFPYIQSLAVLIFFLLSGFLTNYSLSQKEQGYTYYDFLKGRFRRIYTFYLPSLFFIYVLDKISIILKPEAYSHYDTLTLGIFIKNIFMIPRTIQLPMLGGAVNENIPLISRLLVTQPLGSGRPLWTLFLEWWLYVFYGYFILVFCHKHKYCVKPADACILTLFILLFFHLDLSSQCCFAIFFIGILTNILYARYSVSKVTGYFLVAASSLMFIYISQSVRNAYCLEEIVILSLLFCTIMGTTKNKEKKRRSKFLAFMSAVSYPLYLLHYSIIEFMIHIGYKGSIEKGFVISQLLSIFVAIIFYEIIKSIQLGLIRYRQLHTLRTS